MPSLQGRVLRFELKSEAWLVPGEVEVFGSASDSASSRLIDMHNGFLHGQNQVWPPLNQNQGSLDPDDQLVQTFRFTEPVVAGSSNAAFAAVSASTELDVNELIVYRGSNGGHLVSKVTAVSTVRLHSPQTCRSPNQITPSSGAFTEIALTRTSATTTPSAISYSRRLDTSELSLMGDKKYLFPGDSCMQQGLANA